MMTIRTIPVASAKRLERICKHRMQLWGSGRPREDQCGVVNGFENLEQTSHRSLRLATTLEPPVLEDGSTRAQEMRVPL